MHYCVYFAVICANVKFIFLVYAEGSYVQIGFRKFLVYRVIYVMGVKCPDSSRHVISIDVGTQLTLLVSIRDTRSRRL